jgi:pimeloyl-ACP methyl ester carboxylesterase
VRRQLLLAALAGALAVAGQGAARRYRLDGDKAYARLAAIAAPPCPPGSVWSSTERGRGDPVLAIHGFFGGSPTRRCSPWAAWRPAGGAIAPSRFVYLGSRMPAGATVAGPGRRVRGVLDQLGVGKLDVLAISSGATSVFQLALRHPGRVKSLAVISGNMPGGAAAVAPPAVVRLIYRDRPMWMLKVIARPVLLR